MRNLKKIFLLSGLLSVYACAVHRGLPPMTVPQPDWKTFEVPPSPQSVAGNPEAGLHFLIYGNYLGTGIPWKSVRQQFGKSVRDGVFFREGHNAHAPYLMNVFEAANGVMVMNGNCFTCHAGALNGKVTPTVGNSFSDFRKSYKPIANLTYWGVRMRYGKNSEEWAAFRDFGRYFKKMAPHIRTNQPGANPAFRLAEACMMHRHPADLTYSAQPQFDMRAYTVATDVPPLWNVKKKNALYYDGIGRGDFSKLVFQASVLGTPDSSAAREALPGFQDVVAWLRTLEPPKWPAQTDLVKAARGKVLFEENCSKCHGTYGDTPTYPNKVVALDVVKTDPLYVHYIHQSGIVEWYNSSWFAKSEPRSWFEPLPGYIAPPLDGIWASAPYLHNGSVPNLEALLNSSIRPEKWKRSGNSKDYDFSAVGWKFEPVLKGKKGGWVFDTTLPGYSNSGHTFGDKFSPEERQAVLEYLKTL